MHVARDWSQKRNTDKGDIQEKEKKGHSELQAEGRKEETQCEIQTNNSRSQVYVIKGLLLNNK